MRLRAGPEALLQKGHGGVWCWLVDYSKELQDGDLVCREGSSLVKDFIATWMVN